MGNSFRVATNDEVDEGDDVGSVTHVAGVKSKRFAEPQCRGRCQCGQPAKFEVDLACSQREIEGSALLDQRPKDKVVATGGRQPEKTIRLIG